LRDEPTAGGAVPQPLRAWTVLPVSLDSPGEMHWLRMYPKTASITLALCSTLMVTACSWRIGPCEWVSA
jgi:hypothetical protein